MKVTLKFVESGSQDQNDSINKMISAEPQKFTTWVKCEAAVQHTLHDLKTLETRSKQSKQKDKQR